MKQWTKQPGSICFVLFKDVEHCKGTAAVASRLAAVVCTILDMCCTVSQVHRICTLPTMLASWVTRRHLDLPADALPVSSSTTPNHACQQSHKGCAQRS